MIKDVDKSEVISSHLIQSPVLVPISTKELTINLRYIMDFGEEFKAIVLQEKNLINMLR